MTAVPKRREVVFDIEPRELAGLFVAKGWQYGGIKQVQPDDIETVIAGLVRGLECNPARYAELGRFLVFRDSEYPDSLEIAMKVGHVSYYALDMDRPDETPEGNTA